MKGSWHERLKALARSNLISVNKLIDERAAVTLANYDARVRFETRAALGNRRRAGAPRSAPGAICRPSVVVIDEFLRMCTIHTMTSAELIRRMKKAGWVLRGSKGSHHIFIHPQRPGHVSVPHPKKDLGAGLLDKLMKQTGLQ